MKRERSGLMTVMVLMLWTLPRLAESQEVPWPTIGEGLALLEVR
jgi:hypothetical protein